MSIAELVQSRRPKAAQLRDREEQVEALQSRLMACVSVLESLIQTGRVDPGCHETIERAVRQARRRLPRR